MNSTLEASADRARAKYEKSLGVLKERIAELPAVIQRLSAIDRRLEALESRSVTVRAELEGRCAALQAGVQAPETLPRGCADTRGVRLADDAGRGSISQQSRVGTARRSLCASGTFLDGQDALANAVRAMGGRCIELETGSDILGHLECILVEPVGKKLRPSEFVTTGVAIILHGMESSPEVLEEWGSVVKQASWLDHGLSIVVPNLQMSAALQHADLVGLVESILATVGFSKCMLVGKGWGGLRSVELAADPRMAGVVEGVVLVAPSSPPPHACCAAVPVPVLILWAQDDEVSPFEDSEEWLDVLDGRGAPTRLHEAETGGHRVDALLQSGTAAEVLKSFTVATLLMAELADLPEKARGDQQLTRRSMRLVGELPRFMQKTLSGRKSAAFASSSEEEEEEKEFTSSKVEAKNVLELTQMVPEWIHSGMSGGRE